MALIAKIEDRKGEIISIRVLFNPFCLSAIISEKTIIPSVAKAESQRDMSKTVQKRR